MMRLTAVLFFLLLLLGSSEPSYARTQQRKRESANADDYYQILNLKRSATPKDIKSSYRKLALKYHPDKAAEKDKEASEAKFIKVSEAYSILSDEEKRKIYDKYGKQGLDMHEKGMDPEQAGFGGGNFGGGGGGHQHFTFQGGGAQGFDPFKLFEEMFSGGGFPGGPGGGGNMKFKVNMGGNGGGFPGGAGGFPGGGGYQQNQQPPSDLFPKGQSKVAKLGKPKFPDATSKHIWLVMFYTSMNSDNVQEAASQLKLLAEKSPFKVGAVDCEHPRESQFCQQTLGPDKMNGGALLLFAMVIDGELLHYDETTTVPTAKALYEFASDSMPQSLIVGINHVNQVEERLLSKKAGAILLLTDKYETSNLYYCLSYQFRDSLIFGESRAKNLGLAKEFHVKKYPLLVALVPKGTGENKYTDTVDISRYQGKMTLEDLSKWVSTVVKKRDKGKPPKKRKQSTSSSSGRRTKTEF